MCKTCGYGNQRKFTAEVAIHFPGGRASEEPVAWVFPEVVVCVECGVAEFAVPKTELSLLTRDDRTEP